MIFIRNSRKLKFSLVIGVIVVIAFAIFITNTLHKPNHKYKITLSCDNLNDLSEEVITLNESEYKKTQKVIGLIEGKKLVIMQGMIVEGEYNGKTICYNPEDPIQSVRIKDAWNPIIKKIEEEHGTINLVTIDAIEKVPIK